LRLRERALEAVLSKVRFSEKAHLELQEKDRRSLEMSF
jgi:hypothetical protein